MFKIFSKFLDVNQKEVDRLFKIVSGVNDFEPTIKKLKDKDFPNKTADIKERLQKGAGLEDVLPEAFATVREATVRTLGKRLFDVQLMAATALFE
ncbi:MAG: Protein translocase subunit SecA, partial [Candidatus Woesebacteria bacterium GW2011_GWD1_38_10]